MLYGNYFQNSNKCVGGGGSSSSRIAHARHVHREVCSLLLASFEALQSRLHEFMRLLPAWQQLRIDKADSLARYSTLAELAKVEITKNNGPKKSVWLIQQLCCFRPQDTHHRSNLLYGTRNASSTPPWERLKVNQLTFLVIIIDNCVFSLWRVRRNSSLWPTRISPSSAPRTFCYGSSS